jgi:hypothetical protein
LLLVMREYPPDTLLVPPLWESRLFHHFPFWRRCRRYADSGFPANSYAITRPRRVILNSHGYSPCVPLVLQVVSFAYLPH